MTADNTIKGLRKYMHGIVFQLRLMPCYYATKSNVFTHTNTHTHAHCQTHTCTLKHARTSRAQAQTNSQKDRRTERQQTEIYTYGKTHAEGHKDRNNQWERRHS